MKLLRYKQSTLLVKGLKPVAVFLVLCLTLVLNFPVSSWSKEDQGKEFRKLFKVLESGNSISSVLDRSRWPKNDLLSSYLELELLLHHRYRMTTKRLRHFLQSWPNHAYADRVRRKMESRIKRSGTDSEALSWYDKNRPKSTTASVHYLKLLLKENRFTKALPLWKSLYRRGVLFPKNINSKTKSFEKRPTTLEHEARARNLLKRGHETEFNKVLRQLPSARQAYFHTLKAAFHGRKKFYTLLGKLSPKAAASPELWDMRAKGLYRSTNKRAFIKFILSKDSSRMSTKTRRLLRFRMGRNLYHKRNLTSAITLLQTNIVEAGGKLADSLWLAAWSAHLQGDRKKALAWFIQLATEAPTGQHLAKGAFWASKLSFTNKQKDKWLAVAAKYPGSFYGLLASEKLLGTLPALAKTTQHCPSAWGNKLEKSIHNLKLLKSAGRSHYVGAEIYKLANQHKLSNNDQLCLAQKLGAADVIVKLANRVQHKGQPLWNALYPIPDWTPLRGWSLDPALVWATTRQESLFSHRAESSAQALGLMQLIPTTAKEEAKRTGMQPSNRYWLQLPAYNLALGQSYLTRMLKRFDGDLVLALASYNAGPGRGDKWKRRREKEDSVTFIEKIPFTETRNYVKRVIHGFAMYRLRFYGSASLESFIKPGEKKLPLAKK